MERGGVGVGGMGEAGTGSSKSSNMIRNSLNSLDNSEGR